MTTPEEVTEKYPVFDSPPSPKRRARSYQRRPGPARPRYGIPREHWPAVRRRIEQGESLRQVASAYNVSYQTIWRILHHNHNQQQEGEA